MALYKSVYYYYYYYYYYANTAACAASFRRFAKASGHERLKRWLQLRFDVESQSNRSCNQRIELVIRHEVTLAYHTSIRWPASQQSQVLIIYFGLSAAADTEISVYKYSPLTIGYDCLKAISEKRWTYELNNNNNNNTVTRSEDTGSHDDNCCNK